MADPKMSVRMDAKRRLFLQAVGMGAAGLAVGGGGSWLYNRLMGSEAMATGAVAPLRLTDAPLLDTEANALQSQLTSLSSELSGVTAQNQQLATALKIAQDESAALRLRVAELEGQLSSANERLAHSSNVISLYDQLEAVGLDGVASAAVQGFAATLTSSLSLVPAAAAGVAIGRGLLTTLDTTLTTLNGSLGWLNQRMADLKLNLFGLELSSTSLTGAASAGVAAAFSGLVGWIINYLPFDIGRKSREAFSAAQKVVDHNQTLSAEVDREVFEKLAPQLGDGPVGIKVAIGQALRDQALAPSENLVNALSGTQASYANTVQTPIADALTRRAALREQITAARQAAGL